MKKIAKGLVIIVICFSAILCIYKLWNYYTFGPWTRDAKIRAEVIQATSEVSGRLETLRIKDNQFVKKGDVLLTIDKSDYTINVERALSQLEILKTQKAQAQSQYERRMRLSNIAITKEDLETSRIKLEELNGQLRKARTDLKKSELDLTRTTIRAPADGYITNLNTREGSYISAGQSLFALVDINSFYILAYFEETKLAFLDLGKKVVITPYGGQDTWGGEITGIGRAIVDQSASTGEQMLKDVKPNYPWVRLAQRIPVRIAITPEQLSSIANRLVAGTTCTVKVVESL